MKQLTCEMCGSTDLMKQDGVFVCQSCGCKYSVEEAKKMMVEGTVDVSGSTVKIDNSDAISEQVSIWEKMAGDAFSNSNYSEAYTYYCKILEKRVDYWFATYRKGICMGWQASLSNMYASEVLGGVIDATKLLYADETQTDSQKASKTLIMAIEVCDWVQAVNNLAVKHCYEYGNKLVSAAREFYQEEQVISELVKFNIGMITEFIYENYENKEELESLVNAMCNMGQTIVGNMNATFRIKTGSKWNSFWSIYEDVYENVYPDCGTANARNSLSFAVGNFRDNLRTWKSNYDRKLAEQVRKEKEERKTKYWEEHADEKHQYETRLAAIEVELKELRETFQQYDIRISEITGDLAKNIPSESQLSEIKQQQSSLMSDKSKLGLFSGKQKKQLQAQIDALQADIDRLQKSIDCQKKAISDDVGARVAVVENERSPYKKQINALEQEKSKINEELVRDR